MVTVSQQQTTPPEGGQVLSEQSVRLLLAEHERIRALFIENRQMGERRTSLYLTLIAVTTPVLAALSQYTGARSITWLHVVTMCVLILVGFLTFYRLIERRIETVKLLRAINRIHRYFVMRDPALAEYLAWKAEDRRVTYIERRGSLPGLRDLVQVLNACLTGLIVTSILWLTAIWLSSVVLWVAAVVFTGLAWFVQQRIEIYWLTRAEDDEPSAGPRQ